MTASSLADKPPEFWEAVGYDYYDGLALRQICTRHHISLGQFNLAQAELGWRRRRTKQVSRERLIRRMFALLDNSVTQVEAQMRISTTPADPKKPIPKPTATKTTREALVLNRLAMTLGKLIDLETETVAEKKPRQTRQMLDVRDRLVQRIEELSASEEAIWASQISPAKCAEIYFDWNRWAHDAQKPPPGDWVTWLLLGGRGAGKTRAGAEWVRGLAAEGVSPIALVGESMIEALAVMVNGPSGLMNVSPDEERPMLSGTTLYWPNGVEAQILGAADPERFRGPQFAAAWCDELGKWTKAEAAWDMLQFGLRLGDRPRQLVTTTPRPTKLLKRLLAEPTTVVTRMTTAENKKHLANSFLSAVVARYRGSVLGRQELEGELIEDMPGALWTRDMFRRDTGEVRGRIVVALDPPATAHAGSDACGLVVAARTESGFAVLADLSFAPAPPLSWARRAVAAFAEWGADCIVAEANQGGDMVKAVLAEADPDVPVRLVHATRGKWVRAEPVAALYAQGRVTHAAGLTALEDELCSFGADGRSAGHSPDRVDALVWALTELMGKAGPRVRGV